MKKLLFVFTLGATFIKIGVAQKINYTVQKDAPQFENIPNLYITPYLISTDFPLYGPNPDGILSGYVFGFGIRTHANLGNKFQVDLNFSQGLWPAKTRHFDIGGAMILKTKTKSKTTDIILSTKSPNLNTEVQQFITVPYTLLRFSGVRGGITHYKSVFDFKEGAFDKVLNAVPGASGHTNSIGIYGGLTWGKIGNLQIQLKDKRERSHAVYQQFYADVMVVAHMHNYISNTANKTVYPFGFRIGADVYRPTVGILGKGTKFINVEIGYRPGYDGVYARAAFTFLQIRRNAPGLNPKDI